METETWYRTELSFRRRVDGLWDLRRRDGGTAAERRSRGTTTSEALTPADVVRMVLAERGARCVFEGEDRRGYDVASDRALCAELKSQAPAEAWTSGSRHEWSVGDRDGADANHGGG